MRPRSRDDFAIAIICALPLKAEAVEALFEETYDWFGKYYGKQRGDANTYINGWIGKHDVVLCYLPGMGKGSAAGIASSLQVSYTGIELALVVGICGGAPPPPKYQEMFLGDVIISNSVIKYDFGKQYPGGFQWKTGIKNTLGRPGPEIRGLLKSLRAENARNELENQTQQYLHILQQRAKWCHPGASNILFRASYLHKHYSYASPAGCSCLGKILEASPTSIYIGPVASADTVMKSGQYCDEIVRNKKVIGFKMEGAGGVCNYADSHKNKLWQAYAAATRASATKAFLEYWPVNYKDTSRNRHLMIPFARNPHFVGRQEEIQKIKDLISAPDGPKKLAITRLGRVGKTQLALELAYHIQDREPEYSIFWIPCTSHKSVKQTCMTIAQMVGIQDVEPAEVKERLKIYLTQTNKKWILIFDNADNMDIKNGHILFTSRNQQLALNLALPNVLSVPDLLQDNHVTRILLEQLAFLPLAISQAAAYINKSSISLARYMSLLGKYKESTIELLAEEFKDNGCYAEIQNLVATTWLISFLQIQYLDKEASNYLLFMACISPRDIPELILPLTTSAKKRVEALGILKAYSFITMQLDKVFPGNNHENQQIWREYLPHALYLVDSAGFQAYQDNHENFLTRVGSCLLSNGRYTKAETLFRNVLRA
ncbi:putative kinesin light chain [Aspergillus similis]